jgi:hypothetical protein
MARDEERVDPREFLRALLHLKPEDAERARSESPATRPRKPPEGPHHDYGDDGPEDESAP